MLFNQNLAAFSYAAEVPGHNTVSKVALNYAVVFLHIGIIILSDILVLIACRAR